ncbi:unnamed protein product [Paramecium primaurelia]|uniref:Uncharacterized protein n=1 Tax=Paramecium primaurelia TaxID=5886 RepID=A0A8S1QSE1_PARPR|nr:unnamed protein product [Paramecium primaurelia]
MPNLLYYDIIKDSDKESGSINKMTKLQEEDCITKKDRRKDQGLKYMKIMIDCLLKQSQNWNLGFLIL